MAYRARTRKRVRAIRRAPDGSAFQKCESCGLSVPIALVDMHKCESNGSVKRFKAWRPRGSPITLNFEDQPRSAFRFFMEEFVKSCEEDNEITIDRKGFEKWNVRRGIEERQQYVILSEKVDSSYRKALLEEENMMSWMDDDEADSAEVGKYDKNYEQKKYYRDGYEISENFLFWSESSDRYDSTDWGKRLRNNLKE